MGDERRVVRVQGTIPSEKIEEALAAQAAQMEEEEGEAPTRAHVMATLVHQMALENLEPANEILEGKDFKFDCQLELLDPQSKRSRQIRDRLRRDLLDQ